MSVLICRHALCHATGRKFFYTGYICIMILRHFLPLLLQFVALWCAAQGVEARNNRASPAVLTRSQLIFYDDFSSDSSGDFPAKWQVSDCVEGAIAQNKLKDKIKVAANNGAHALQLKTTFLQVMPVVKGWSMHNDSFTVEFDFRFDANTACTELNLSKVAFGHPCTTVTMHIAAHGGIHFSGAAAGTAASMPADSFDCAAWHRCVVSYSRRSVTYLLDNGRPHTLSDCGFEPNLMSMGCIAPVSYKRVRITRGAPGSEFSALVSGGRVVTHSINFAVDDSVVSSECIATINELAALLRNNTAMQLEITGHTDNTGDPAHNRYLSLARARAIKAELVKAGIDKSRLKTNGAGALKPMATNNTEAGRQANRRVEFRPL